MTFKLLLKPLLLFLLMPLSILWDLVYRVRRFLYSFNIFKSRSFYVPIISVGNLTFGGTGKTPFTLWLANYFNDKKMKVMILTRGYKGELENKSGILHSSKRLGFNPFEYGDEATMLVRRLKNAVVVVGKNRSENLEYYFSDEEPDLVLLDDGHQHLKLKRELNIVLFDALLPLSRYKVAPSGYLREGLSALKDADIIVIGRSDQVHEDRLAELKFLLSQKMKKSIPMIEMKYIPTAFQNSAYDKVFTLGEIRDEKVICVAGVASPESFFSLVENLGANIIDKISFPDHHKFNANEINEILIQARKEGAYLLTTEKDIVKIRRLVDDPLIIHMEIQIEFISGKESLLKVLDKYSV